MFLGQILFSASEEKGDKPKVNIQRIGELIWFFAASREILRNGLGPEISIHRGKSPIAG